MMTTYFPSAPVIQTTGGRMLGKPLKPIQLSYPAILRAVSLDLCGPESRLHSTGNSFNNSRTIGIPKILLLKRKFP
jgi:hypothetical protein